MSFIENLFLALIFFATLNQETNQKTKFKPPSVMKTLQTKLTVAKSTIGTFAENNKGKYATISFIICPFYN
jgi:hypothetical protein